MLIVLALWGQMLEQGVGRTQLLLMMPVLGCPMLELGVAQNTADAHGAGSLGPNAGTRRFTDPADAYDAGSWVPNA